MLIFVLWTVANLVALRKESVDRNGFGAKLVHSFLSSLSARRAWIEMTDDVSTGGKIKESLSARRAWIEIILTRPRSSPSSTSLSARRAWIEIVACGSAPSANGGRSPQGERG